MSGGYQKVSRHVTVWFAWSSVVAGVLLVEAAMLVTVSSVRKSAVKTATYCSGVVCQRITIAVLHTCITLILSRCTNQTNHRRATSSIFIWQGLSRHTNKQGNNNKETTDYLSPVVVPVKKKDPSTTRAHRY